MSRHHPLTLCLLAAAGVAADPAAGGPGDPTTVIPAGIAQPVRVIPDANGTLLAIADAGFTVRRVTPEGAVSLVVPAGRILASALARDGFGGLLLVGQVFDGTPPEGLWRRTTAGTFELLYPMPSTAATLATGPDADIWVMAVLSFAVRLVHFDRDGAPLDSVDLPNTPGWLGVAPDGTPHWRDADGIHRFVGGVPELVIPLANSAAQCAFDRDGYLYVANQATGTVALYDPAYQLVTDSFATTNQAGTATPVFLTASDGQPTARLFGLREGELVEVNPAGVRAPGARVGPNTFLVARSNDAPLVVGAPWTDTLTAADGTPVERWRIVAGALPAGLALDSLTGVVQGVPHDAGDANWTVEAVGATRYGRRQFIETVTVPTVTVDAAARELFGHPGSLPPAGPTYLDFVGNDNGRYDLGDLRALLLREGVIQ